jgi:EAL domain-containing protein (putative c-di-GMP-specific phosphodiesterase class I)
MTVNLSGRQLHDADLVSDVRAALEDSGFDPRCLVLEITESVVMRNADVGISRLEELRALGVRLAIDDFGTGYSSLSYLQRLPIDVLKIDKSFIDGVDDDARGAALVRTILGLAETMSLRCVAEGIETESQLQALTALGCAYGQGFLFAHPLPADAAGERLVARVTAV